MGQEPALAWKENFLLGSFGCYKSGGNTDNKIAACGMFTPAVYFEDSGGQIMSFPDSTVAISGWKQLFH